MKHSKHVAELHSKTLDRYFEFQSVRDILGAQAETLVQAHQHGDGRACIQLSNWHPDWVGKSFETNLAGEVDLDAARLAIAREHGYEDWAAVETKGDISVDPVFEKAVDAVIAGDELGLQNLLSEYPALINQRSTYGHRATLLIYTAANGVETWRQFVPRNAAAIIRLLLDAGADKEATMFVYGGEHTTLALTQTSAHPKEAGVLEAMVAELTAG